MRKCLPTVVAALASCVVFSQASFADGNLGKDSPATPHKPGKQNLEPLTWKSIAVPRFHVCDLRHYVFRRDSGAELVVHGGNFRHPAECLDDDRPCATACPRF